MSFEINREASSLVWRPGSLFLVSPDEPISLATHGVKQKYVSNLFLCSDVKKCANVPNVSSCIKYF